MLALWHRANFSNVDHFSFLCSVTCVMYQEFFRASHELLVLWMLYVTLDCCRNSVLHLCRDHSAAKCTTVWYCCVFSCHTHYFASLLCRCADKRVRARATSRLLIWKNSNPNFSVLPEGS